MAKLTQYGEVIVHAFEGCLRKIAPGQFKAYFDPVGVLTIGRGHTNHHSPRFDANTVWSQAQCDQVFRGDMQVHEKHVEALAPGLPWYKNDALISWSFNTGGPANSSVWTYVKSGNDAEAVIRLHRWNKAGGKVFNGLVRRRKAEGELYLNQIDAAFKTAGVGKPDVTESVRADRVKPRPPAKEVAKRTKAEAATTAAGASTTGASTQVPSKQDFTLKVVEYAGYGFGVAILLIGLVLLVKKARFVIEDWA